MWDKLISKEALWHIYAILFAATETIEQVAIVKYIFPV